MRGTPLRSNWATLAGDRLVTLRVFYDARKRSRHGAETVAQTRSTVPASAPNSTGLTRNASNPAAEGESLRASNALAVRATIGVGDQPNAASRRRKRRVASYPSRPGILRSI